MSNVELNNIYALYALIPLAILVIIPFFIFVRKKGFRIYKFVSLFLHLVICTLVCLSLSGIHVSEVESSTQVYVLADVSSTTKLKIEEMDHYIEELHEKLPLSNDLGVVAFAKDSVELVKPGHALKSLQTAEVDKSATNLQEALTYTSNLFAENMKKRIIVLSDGRQTEGNVENVIQQLESLQIRVDSIFIDTLLEDFNKEMQIESVTGNVASYLNSGETLKINVRSNYADECKINIYDNDELIETLTHNVIVGLNQIEWSCDTSKTGDHHYRFQLDLLEDYEEENNTYLFDQSIHEKCQIAVISDSYKEASYIMDMINSFAETRMFLLYNSDITSSLTELIGYDEIILSNAMLNNISNGDSIIDTLETLVFKYGKTLLTFGGESAYYDGGYKNTKLESMLPVNIDPNDMKKRTAVIILLDISGSMSGSKLRLAKSGAISCLDILDDDDYYGLITFEDKVRVAAPMQPVANKNAITKMINAIQEGGGTMMTPGIQEAFKELESVKNEVENRNVIIISDGSPFDGGQVELVQKMADSGITVSSIEIGGGTALMRQIATTGNGSYYAIADSGKIPEIILNAVEQTTFESKIYGNLPVNIALKNEAVVENIQSLPAINGLNFTTPKYNSTTVLSTEYTFQTGESVSNIPVYSYWHYGEGIVASFMSGVYAQQQAKGLFDTEIGKRLFVSIVKSTFPTKYVDSVLSLQSVNHGYTSTLYVDAPSVTSKMRLKAVVTSPSGESADYEFTIKNGKFTQEILTPEVGRYDVSLRYYREGFANVDIVNTSFNFSYSSEYNVFEKSDNIVLWQICCNEGTLAKSIDDIANIEQENITYTQYYTIPLLISALILFILDIMIRMLRAKDIKSLFKKTVS